MKNTVTPEQIDALLTASQIEVCTRFDKVTIVTVKLPNGFVLVESSGAVDAANYSEEIGARTCLERIKAKLWQFEGYSLSTKLADAAFIERCAQLAATLVVKIEASGASPELTDAVVAADALRNALKARR